MKAALRVGKWRPLVGVCCLSLATVGLSLRLEGAVPSDREVDSSVRSVAPPTERESSYSGPVSNQALWARAGSAAVDGLPILGTEYVDWRDDQPTKLRKAGLLDGALPLPTFNRVATGGCTFNIECEDGDPCTTDVCDIDVANGVGSGKCVNNLVEDGQAGECDDGLFCNGAEFCQGGVCVEGPQATCCDTPGEDQVEEYCTDDLGRCSAESPQPNKRCSTDEECGGGVCDHCIPTCTADADCDDGIACNGTETCDTGTNRCLGGVPLCGAGASCSEKRCDQIGGGPCIDEEDCNNVACVENPLCFFGRCCTGTNDCAARRLEPHTPSCTGRWYPGDAGNEPGAANTCGGQTPFNPGVQLGCPSYSSGIEQLSQAAPPEYPVAVGPMSMSAAAIAPPNGPGGPLNRLGDDYTFNHASHINVRAVRIAGFMSVPDAIFFEFWDAQGNFIEDFLWRPGSTPGIKVLKLEEPLAVPPNGRVSVIFKREFAANAKFIWLSATGATTGSNDDTKLYVNDELGTASPSATNFLAPDPGVLAFELVGEQVGAPLGGCCASDGSCTNELDWVCTGTLGGTFQGEGNFCNICEFGDMAGASCGVCDVASTNSGDPCDSSEECDGGLCVADDSVCNAGSSTCSNSPETLCTTAGDCNAIPGVCSNTDLNCVLDTDCPAGGTCGGAPTCEPGVCAALDACGTGACCSDADGTCTLTTAGACTSPDVFRGLGSNCDPNCCVQPALDTDCSDGICYTGADNCADAFVHVIPDLDPSTNPVHVVTITGDRTFASATDAEPDSCWGVASAVTSDQGWWEAFSLTGNCTRVRFDYCCTTPTQFGDWAFVTKDCACNEIVNNTADPNLPSPITANRGKPFCDEDNLWTVLGVLPSGTYYIPVNSTLEDDLGQYQLHIVAEACPEVACCLPDGTCQDGLNQFECQDLSGTYLGPPNKFPSTALCAATAPGDPGNPCNTGSCCIGPGECEDEDSGTPIDQDLCLNTLGGTSYEGGLKCEGGTCSLDPAFSCNDAADCSTDVGGPGGTCNAGPGGDRALAQPNPCPLCEIESPGTCQLWDDGPFFFTLADRGIGSGLLHADDFIAGPGLTEVDRVCTWGSYFTQVVGTPLGEGDCSENPDAIDSFRVRILRTNRFGLPDANNPVGTSDVSLANTAKAEIPGCALETGALGLKCYAYQLTLDSVISGLKPGNRYWIEVSNNLPAIAECSWNWSPLSADSDQGNGIATAGSDGDGYKIGGTQPMDLAWCLSGQVETPDADIRPCCDCVGNCFSDTLPACNAQTADYQAAEVLDLGVCKPETTDCNTNDDCNEGGDCVGTPEECGGGFDCPPDGRPANDDCENATPLSVGSIPLSTHCSTTDGHNGPELCYSDNGSCAGIDSDLWFSFVPVQDCALSLDLCNSGTTDIAFDSGLAVYSNGTSECPCPLDGPTTTATLIDAQDDSCVAGQPLGGPARIIPPIGVQEGICYMIRVGSYAGQGSRGLGVLDVSCGPAICGDNTTQTSIGEECDGIDVSLCGSEGAACNPPDHATAPCTCVTPVCGNGATEGDEECDGADDGACPGLCQSDCTCNSVCGNGIKEGGEECDGSSDTSCGGVAGRCLVDCTCPPRVCGNDFKDPGEDCDGADQGICADGESCRLPGDPAGECTCVCTEAGGAPDPIVENPDGFDRVRFITFQVPGGVVAGGTETAIRVELTSVASPPGAPSGRQFRYVNAFGFDGTNPGANPLTCPDAAPTFPDYGCARLGCEPEYRDWVGEAGGSILAVTGDAVVPSTTYTVSHIAAACGAAPAADSCASASAGVAVSTGVWGDIVGPGNGPPDGSANVLDISAAVDKVKGLATAFPEPRVWHKTQNPAPDVDPINVLDIGFVVDAVKGLPYPFSIVACP